jgi:hypothetical protein
MKITKEQGELRHSILCKISHYEWLLTSKTLNIKHELWIKDQLKDLTASLAQFHPNHPLLKTGENK